MTSKADIVNRALQVVGTRTTVTDVELVANGSNEAIQANVAIDNIRRRLLRMAPWDCALKSALLTYITSIPGTPENTNTGSTSWAPGIPVPPWAYEYQYPVDCLRACWLVPATSTYGGVGFPITSLIPYNYRGGPIPFKVQTDTFIPVTAAAIALAGAGYAVNDIITLAPVAAQVGAPAQLLVTAVNPVGAITSALVISAITSESSPLGGSYFVVQQNPVGQGSTTGAGLGGTFNLTFGSPSPQRVILTNLQTPILAYCQEVTDYNVMDDLFQDALAKILGATLVNAISGDKNLAKLAISEANEAISIARSIDGNEGLTINDHTPDWIRIRGGDYAPSSTIGASFNWGPLWPMY